VDYVALVRPYLRRRGRGGVRRLHGVRRQAIREELTVRASNRVSMVEVQGLGLTDLLESWELHLNAARKADATVRSYIGAVDRYLRWCAAGNHPAPLARVTVRIYVAGLLAAGREASTVRTELRGLKLFSAWLLAEGETESDDLKGLRSPKVDEKVIDRLTDEQCVALIKACQGREFRDRRDEAIVRLLVESPCRGGDIAGMRVGDVDLRQGIVTVRRGKGGKGRLVAFGPKTAQALDRYMRLRRSHRLASTPDFWLGDRGRTLGFAGLGRTLRYRANLAGIEVFWPHLLRHTAAHRWLAAGGSEGGLMAVAGWTSPEMMWRYTKSSAQVRAVEEARTLNLGEL
jgi:integrase/recombinase XerD